MWESPDPGDIVWYRFPQRPHDVPGPKPRPDLPTWYVLTAPTVKVSGYHRGMRLIFLDFDGVLHPTDAIHHRENDSGSTRITGDRLFRHAPQLNALLENHLDVAVVISSDWHLSQPLEELKVRLGELGGRVIGTTSHTALPGITEYSLEVTGLTRYWQCERLASHLGVEDWCLIDDHVDIVFGPERATPDMMRRVIFCDPIMGLDTWVTVGRLEKWLAD